MTWISCVCTETRNRGSLTSIWLAYLIFRSVCRVYRAGADCEAIAFLGSLKKARGSCDMKLLVDSVRVLGWALGGGGGGRDNEVTLQKYLKRKFHGSIGAVVAPGNERSSVCVIFELCSGRRSTEVANQCFPPGASESGQPKRGRKSLAHDRASPEVQSWGVMGEEVVGGERGGSEIS
ncbi:hypothetical protein KM043_004565 [Ampulex compressa]|nr:hypothetical protein KM043_004565 [Ampulex compressa]